MKPASKRAIEESPAAALGRKGGAARAASLTPKQRSSSARKAAKARWGTKTKAVR